MKCYPGQLQRSSASYRSNFLPLDCDFFWEGGGVIVKEGGYFRLGMVRERSGSVVECLTRDRGAVGLSLTGVTVLWSLSKTHLS